MVLYARADEGDENERKREGVGGGELYGNIILINRVPVAVPVVRSTLRFTVTTHWS